MAGLGCKASWEKCRPPHPFITGVSEEGEGHPCPAERGQREDSSEQLDGAQGPFPSTSVQLPCRSPGVGQYLSLSPKIQEMYGHTNECAMHTSLIPLHTSSQPHARSLLRAHSLTHKASQPTCAHTQSPISLTNFQIHVHSRAHTCAHNTFS